MKKEKDTIVLDDVDGDIVKKIGHQQEDQFFDMMMNNKAAFGSLDNDPRMPGSFVMNMACHQLMMLEERIINAEKEPGPVVDVEEERARYVAKRAQIESDPEFQEIYDRLHEEDPKKLPVFYSDGSHD